MIKGGIAEKIMQHPVYTKLQKQSVANATKCFKNLAGAFLNQIDAIKNKAENSEAQMKTYHKNEIGCCLRGGREFVFKVEMAYLKENYQIDAEPIKDDMKKANKKN